MKIKETDLAQEKQRVECLGKFEVPDTPEGTKLWEIKVRGLEARFFGGVSTQDAAQHGSSSSKSSSKNNDNQGTTVSLIHM